MNICAIIAYSGVATIQQDVGFDVGFLVPLISMIIALVIFELNKSNYISSPATGNISIIMFRLYFYEDEILVLPYDGDVCYQFPWARHVFLSTV